MGCCQTTACCAPFSDMSVQGKLVMGKICALPIRCALSGIGAIWIAKNGSLYVQVEIPSEGESASN